MKEQTIEVPPVIPLNDEKRVYEVNYRYLFREDGIWYSGRVIWSGAFKIKDIAHFESSLPRIIETDKRINSRKSSKKLEPYEPVFKVTLNALSGQLDTQELEELLTPHEQTPFTELLKLEVLSQFPQIIANFTERDYRPPLGPL